MKRNTRERSEPHRERRHCATRSGSLRHGRLRLHHGWLAADAGLEAAGAISGAADEGGSLATTEAEGSDGSEAGSTGNEAEAEPEGTTTAEAGGVSGVCLLQPARAAKEIATLTKTRFDFIELSMNLRLQAAPAASRFMKA